MNPPPDESEPPTAPPAPPMAGDAYAPAEGGYPLPVDPAAETLAEEGWHLPPGLPDDDPATSEPPPTDPTGAEAAAPPEDALEFVPPPEHGYLVAVEEPGEGLPPAPAEESATLAEHDAFPAAAPEAAPYPETAEYAYEETGYPPPVEPTDGFAPPVDEPLPEEPRDEPLPEATGAMPLAFEPSAPPDEPGDGLPPLHGVPEDESRDALPPVPASIHPPPGVPDAQVALLCDGLERYLGVAEARVHVLRGVSLRLEPGFVHAVVGPSGCGKSSLLYILGLLDRPDAGRLVISGRPVEDLPDDELSHQRNALLGFIFQFHFLLQDFTALENIMIPMRQLRVLDEKGMRDRAAYLLDAVGLGEKGQRPSRHLSGGEQQRVAIARALANDPQVILADEPTGNLDTANSTRVFSLLTDLVHRENKALLLVTHNPAIAEACDWVHTMRDGLIVDQQFAGMRG